MKPRFLDYVLMAFVLVLIGLNGWNSVKIERIEREYLTNLILLQERTTSLNNNLDALIKFMERREKDANNRGGKKRVGRNLFKLRSKALL